MKDGGPAFPTTMPGFNKEGMSLRDYFAAAALPVLVKEGLRLDHKSWDATVEHSYIIAEAMLRERERKK